jgi:hypothetical protein
MSTRRDLECITVELGPDVFLNSSSVLSPRAAGTSIVLAVLPGQRLIDLRAAALSGLHLTEDDVGKVEELGFVSATPSPEALSDDVIVEWCAYVSSPFSPYDSLTDLFILPLIRSSSSCLSPPHFVLSRRRSY